MASAGGQDMLSPYQAMGNDPVSGTDPGGLQPLMRPRPTIPDVNPFGHEIVAWNNPSYGGFTSEAIADMTPGFMPDTDPMGIDAWMDAAGAGQSTKTFWNGVTNALGKLSPGQGQNMYNNGDGTFRIGLVYNLWHANTSGNMISDGSKIEEPNSGSSGTGYSFTHTTFNTFSDDYATVTSLVSTTVTFVDKTKYATTISDMNSMIEVSSGLGRVGSAITAASDIAGNIQYYTNGQYLSNTIKPVSPILTGFDLFFIGLGETGTGPGIIISGIYFFVARPIIVDDGHFVPYSPLPNVDALYVNPPLMK